MHASISCFVSFAALLPTDGNLRQSAGGVSLKPPSPLPIFLSIVPPSCLLPIPSPLRAHQAERNVHSRTIIPANMAAGGGSPPLLL